MPALTHRAGPYCCQIKTAAAGTGWPRIVALYDALAQVIPSPIVELNRAVAVGIAFGPAAGLEIVDSLLLHPQLARYHWLPGVRADLLARLGRHEQARAEFERAAGLAQNAQERQLLQERATAQSRLESFKPRDPTAG